MRIIAWPAYKNRSLNPYNWALYRNLEERGNNIKEFSPLSLIFERFDVFHIHWPDSILNEKNLFKVIFRIFFFFLLMKTTKFKGSRILWTVHNLRSHERFYPKLEKWFWSVFLKHIDGYICLTDTAKNQAIKSFPELLSINGFVIPHGHYKGIYSDYMDKEQARNKLNLPENESLILFIGQIRDYKNVLGLIKAFKKMKERNILLFIAGKPTREQLFNEITEAAKDSRIKLNLNFIPDEDIQVFLRAADLVVLPYEEILNSGSAILSLSFETPILVPEKGSMGELKKIIGADWIYTYEGILNEEILLKALKWALKSSRDCAPNLEMLDWTNVAKKTEDAYYTVAR